MYTLCVSGAVNAQGFFFCFFLRAIYINFRSLNPVTNKLNYESYLAGFLTRFEVSSSYWLCVDGCVRCVYAVVFGMKLVRSGESLANVAFIDTLCRRASTTRLYLCVAQLL